MHLPRYPRPPPRRVALSPAERPLRVGLAYLRECHSCGMGERRIMRTIQQLVQMAFYMALLGAIVFIPHFIAYTLFPA